MISFRATSDGEKISSGSRIGMASKVISWFDIEDPDGNEMRWYQVLTSDTQVTGERQQP